MIRLMAKNELLIVKADASDTQPTPECVLQVMNPYPTWYELLINLKSAKQLGITVAPSVLLRADRVIE